MRSTSEVYKRIKKKVDGIRVIDTHEHLEEEKDRISKKADPFALFCLHYTSTDLISSGMSMDQLQKVRDPTVPLCKRWELLKPFWGNVHNTCYVRVLRTAMRDLYGIDDITDKTYNELALRMKKKNREGLYQWILKEKSGIDVSIKQVESFLGNPDEVDKRFFIPQVKVDDLLMATNITDYKALGYLTGKQILSLTDLVDAVDNRFRSISKKIVGIKIGLAYSREIHFKDVSQNEAEDVFVNMKRSGCTLSEIRPLQDFLVHKIIQLASRERLPILIHTGLQEGNDNVITNSNVTHLINLFREYNDVKFNILHGSYPYLGEMCALTKNFQNVYLDMCFLHITSPYKVRQALAEWLEMVPANKIFGFGGDYVFAEGVYGHLVIARENIARVLSEKVEDKLMSEREAVFLAKKLLRDNAYEFFLCNRNKKSTN